MRAFLLVLFLVPRAVLAQSSEIPRAVVEQLSRDLAQLQRAVAEAQAQLQTPGAPTLAQSPTTPMVTVKENTILRAAAAENAVTVYRVPKGQTLPVLSEVNGWYAVQADAPVQGKILGWLKPGSASPVAAGFVKTTSVDNVFLQLTEHATRMKQSYQNNPYVSVSGFQVNVMPPSVSINFEFKK